MYVEGEGGMKVTTSSLNEELGNVEFILSDKTGTLTKNNMRCYGFSMGGVSFHMDDFAAISNPSSSSPSSLSSSSSSLPSSSSLTTTIDSCNEEKTMTVNRMNEAGEEALASFAPTKDMLITIQQILERGHANSPLTKLEKEYMTDFLRAIFLCNSVG